MYKGNMYEFVEKLDLYLKKNYDGDCRLIFAITPNIPDEPISSTPYIAFFLPGEMSARAYSVTDSLDFEEQVIDYVNKRLEDVQR